MLQIFQIFGILHTLKAHRIKVYRKMQNVASLQRSLQN